MVTDYGAISSIHRIPVLREGIALLGIYTTSFGIVASRVLSYRTHGSFPRIQGRVEICVFDANGCKLVFLFWVIFQPGVVDLASRFLSSEALWDWRLILAVFVWCLNWSFSNYRKVTNLTDLEILAIYDDPACGKGIQQSEKDVTPNA